MNAVEAPIFIDDSPKISEVPSAQKQSLIQRIRSVFERKPKPKINLKELLPYKIPRPDERGSREDLYYE